MDFEVETFIAQPVAASLTRGAESAGKGGYAGRRQEDDVNLVAHALRTEGFDASEDGTGRGTPIVPIAFDTTQITSAANRSVPKPGDPCHPLASTAHPPAVAFQERGRTGGRNLEHQEGVAYSLNAPSGGGRRQEMNIATGWAVRRLTPRECERLMGFPDDFTLITYRGKPAADGPRYKALGNSQARNQMRWIGRGLIEVANALDGRKVR